MQRRKKACWGWMAAAALLLLAGCESETEQQTPQPTAPPQPVETPQPAVGEVGGEESYGGGAVDAPGFAPDPPNINDSLPADYPDHWLMVHDAAFFHMREGRYYIVDPEAGTVGGQVQAMLSADFIATYAQSQVRQEHYVVESFFSRGGRGGERTDVVTIYDMASLAVKGEVIIPPKRYSGMPSLFTAALTDGDRLLVVYNFTPSQSLTVVDLEKREFVAEHDIAGCALAIPTGAAGVTSICSNGAFLTTSFSDGGAKVSSVYTSAVIDMEDPMFEKAGFVDGIGYFPTFSGDFLPVDLSGEAAVPGERWPAVTEEERTAGWRPGGLQLVAADRLGRLYLLMHPQGREGSHKDGGNEVWVFDPKAQKRIARIPLATWGISIGLSNAQQPLLVVTTGDLQLETYDTESGELIKTLLVEAQTPFIVRGVR